MKIGLKYFAGQDNIGNVALFKVTDVSEVRLKTSISHSIAEESYSENFIKAVLL